MGWKDTYEKWLSFDRLDPELKELLEVYSDNEAILEDCFYKNLEFGTGGMRGEIGPGTNRMNRYTIRKASEGLAQYIANQGEVAKQRGVVIAYDSRHKSPQFAMEAALTIARHGIQTYVFEELRPTPELSFAVRYLNAFAGIVVTASHNPSQYNGYKVYNEDGGQLPPAQANKVIDYVNQIDNELTIEAGNEEKLKASGLVTMIGAKIDQAYQDNLKTISVNPDLIKEMAPNLNIVFTPLHGTAYHPVTDGMKNWGFTNVTVVKEQAEPDPNFSTVKLPNPEEHEAFTLAIEYGKKMDADVLLATDPDADRVGVAVKNTEGDYIVLTGNQTGALLLHYLLSEKKKKGVLPDNGVVVKTIVTSEIGRTIASDFGIETMDTLTGFKFIGEKIHEFEQSGVHQFLFGYEESYGYLIGDFVRDKDAVQACLFVAEVAAYYKSQGKTLYEALMDLFNTYGYYIESLESLTLKGKEGSEQIAEVLNYFRKNPLRDIAGQAVTTVEDYEQSLRTELMSGETETITLPKSNVLKYKTENGSWFCLRPSGTEPKIKFYFGVTGLTLESAQQLNHQLKTDFMNKIQSILK